MYGLTLVDVIVGETEDARLLRDALAGLNDGGTGEGEAVARVRERVRRDREAALARARSGAWMAYNTSARRRDGVEVIANHSPREHPHAVFLVRFCERQNTTTYVERRLGARTLLDAMGEIDQLHPMPEWWLTLDALT